MPCLRLTAADTAVQFVGLGNPRKFLGIPTGSQPPFVFTLKGHLVVLAAIAYTVFKEDSYASWSDTTGHRDWSEPAHTSNRVVLASRALRETCRGLFRLGTR
eukprot:3022993-Rhodomonas_salina.1